MVDEDLSLCATVFEGLSSMISCLVQDVRGR